METKIFTPDQIDEAAALIRAGEIVRDGKCMDCRARIATAIAAGCKDTATQMWAYHWKQSRGLVVNNMPNTSIYFDDDSPPQYGQHNPDTPRGHAEGVEFVRPMSDDETSEWLDRLEQKIANCKDQSWSD